MLDEETFVPRMEDGNGKVHPGGGGGLLGEGDWS